MSKPVAVVESTSKFSLVREICALMNLGDEGKMDSFFNKTVKKLNKEVSVLTKNLDTNTFNHEQKLDGFVDQLEDANEALKQAYRNVPVSRITTNEDQNSFIDDYLDNIDSKALDVKRIEESRDYVIKAYEEEQEDIQKQIDSLKRRIATISSPAK